MLVVCALHAFFLMQFSVISIFGASDSQTCEMF